MIIYQETEKKTIDKKSPYFKHEKAAAIRNLENRLIGAKKDIEQYKNTKHLKSIMEERKRIIEKELEELKSF